MSAKSFETFTIAEISRRIQQRNLSIVALVQTCLDRIDQLDPVLQAWVTLDREGAMAVAAAADEEIRAGGPRSPLHGVPIGVKDIMFTAGLRTTAGSPLFSDFIPTYDAACVARLKESGAIVLGKTVTTAFASSDPAGTHNPWNLSHSPGGSSSGSAVAVATRMCAGALGSQTGGSTLRPAAYNGVVGLKPTYGRISCFGVIPLAWTLDTVGLFGQTVEDVAMLLQATAGYDSRDPYSLPQEVPDFLAEMRVRSSRPPHIGILHGWFDKLVDPEIGAHIEHVAQKLREAGARVEDAPWPKSLDNAPAVHQVVIDAEAAAYHEPSFRSHEADYGPNLLANLRRGLQISAAAYTQAQHWRRYFQRDIRLLVAHYDAVLTPSTPTTAPEGLASTGDPIFQCVWSLAGVPTISIPTGVSQSGLPIGAQLIGADFAEGALLAAAQWCESTVNFSMEPPCDWHP